jgi:hypothetical protein
MAKATSSRESSSKTEVSVYSDTSLTDSHNGNIEKRARRPSAARHARKCTVCHHKEREFIDQDYLRWLSPKEIAREYDISHHSVVYRHADATGLRAQRRASLRATLENFIEQAESVRATAGSVVAAVRLYAQINDQGQWTPPVKRFIVEHRSAQSAHPSHTKDDPENSQERSSKGTPTPAPTPAPVPVKVGLPPPVTSAHSSQAKNDPENSHVRSSKGARPAAPLSVSPDKFGAVRPERNARAPQTTGGLSPDPSAQCAPTPQKKHGPSSADSFAAHSAAPLGVSPDKFGAVPPERNARAPQTTGGLSADRLSPESSNAADASPAATSDAQFPEPSAKANKNSDPVNATGSFSPVVTITAGSAVPFSASPDKFPAVPVASINLASDLPISNREHVELEHARLYTSQKL